MIIDYHTVREVSSLIGGAIDTAVEDFLENHIEHEPSITDRMLGGITVSLKGFRAKGIRWTAKTLNASGSDLQEKFYGADFMVVLNYSLPDYKVSKGFLAQAKRLINGKVDKLKRLQEQCEKMLALSPESFVFLYDKNGCESYRPLPYSAQIPIQVLIIVVPQIGFLRNIFSVLLGIGLFTLLP